MAKFSPTKLNQTEFLTNKGINSYLFTEGALDFSPTQRNLLLILEISHQPVGEKCHTMYYLTWMAILLPIYMWIFCYFTIFKDYMIGLEVLAGYYTICSKVAS